MYAGPSCRHKSLQANPGGDVLIQAAIDTKQRQLPAVLTQSGNCVEVWNRGNLRQTVDALSHGILAGVVRHGHRLCNVGIGKEFEHVICGSSKDLAAFLPDSSKLHD